MSSLNKAFKCFSILDFKPSYATFDDRKKVQKIVYMMNSMGVNLKYEYNWYLHGPYSPDLTDDMFDVFERGKIPDTKNVNLSKNEMEAINKIKRVIVASNPTSNDWELYASLQYLIDILETNDIDIISHKSNIIETLKEEKKHFSDMDIENAWMTLRRLNSPVKITK